MYFIFSYDVWTEKENEQPEIREGEVKHKEIEQSI